MKPDVAFFDLDHTVLAVDCEQTWKNLLVDHGICGKRERALARHYIELHAVGTTPREEYQQFMLRDFVGRTREEMEPLARENFEKYLRREIFPKAAQTIAAYRDQEVPVILLSGSNRIIVDPVAKYIGVTDVICTELQLVDGRFTGHIDGLFRIQEHKVSGVQQWCRSHRTDAGRVAFYGDSMSDVPVFEIVGMPYVVNPSEQLMLLALRNKWSVIAWDKRF